MHQLKTLVFRTLLASSIALAGIFSIIGSGGGGGGSDSGGGGTTPPALLSISSDNAQDVSATVVQAIVLNFEVVDASGGQIAPEQAQAAAADADAGAGLPTGRSLDILTKIAIAVGPVTEPCDSGNGFVTISGDVADLGGLTVGDEFSLDFDQCDDNTGIILDGLLDFVVDALQGDPLTDVFLVTLDTGFGSLVATDGVDSFTVTGDATLTLDSLAFPVVSSSLSGMMLAIASGPEVFTYIDFTQTFTADGGVIPQAITATASGTLDSQLLGGAVNYETVVPIQASGDEDPNAGEILVTGEDDTTVRIVIESAISVRLDIDSNGDGTVDDTQFTTWAELTGQTSVINTSTATTVAREVLAAFIQFPGSTIGGQFTNGSPYANLAQLGVFGNFGPEVVACLNAGDASVSGFIASAGTYSQGDQLDTTFANSCTRGPTTFDGQMDVTVDDFQGTPGGSFRFSGSAALTNLQLAGTEGVFTANGNIDSSYDVGFTTPGSVLISATAAAFTLEDGAVTRNLTSAQADLVVDISTPPPPYPVTSTPSGTLQTTALPGTYTYATAVPLESLLDTDPTTGPSAGEVIVTAEDLSTLRIVAIDQFNARLDIDVDGDTVVDEQIPSSWANLLP